MALTENEIERIRNFPVLIGNELLRTAMIDLSLSQGKTLNVLLAYIKRDDAPGKEYAISIADICAVLGYQERCGYYYKAIKQDFKTLCESRPGAVKWLKYAEIEQRSGTVKYCFADEVTEHIYNLGAGNPYTQYNLIDVISFTHKATFRLFLLMKAHIIKLRDPLTEVWKHKNPFGQRIEFDIIQLKSLLGAKGYLNNADFVKRCIVPALKEITECSNTYNVSYETIKRGIKITGIVLIVSVKLSIEEQKTARAEVKARLDPKARKTRFVEKLEAMARGIKNIVFPWSADQAGMEPGSCLT